MVLLFIFSPPVLAQLMVKGTALGELTAELSVLDSVIAHDVSLAGDVGAEDRKHVV
jgi:hypothetical protein